MNKKILIVGAVALTIGIGSLAVINNINTNMVNSIKQVLESKDSFVKKHGKITCSIIEDKCSILNIEGKDNTLIDKIEINKIKNLEIFFDKEGKLTEKGLDPKKSYKVSTNLKAYNVREKGKNILENIQTSNIPDNIKEKFKKSKLNIETILTIKGKGNKTNVSIENEIELTKLMTFKIDLNAFFISSLKEVLGNLNNEKGMQSLYKAIGIDKIALGLENKGGLIDFFYISYLNEINSYKNNLYVNNLYFGETSEKVLSEKEFKELFLKRVNSKETTENINTIANSFNININIKALKDFLNEKNKEITFEIKSKEEQLLIKQLYLIQLGDYASLINSYKLEIN